MPKPKADDDFDQMMERRRQAKHAFRVDITIGYLLVVVVAAGALFLLYNFVQNTRAEIRQAKELTKLTPKSTPPQSYRQPILLGPDAAVPTKTTPVTLPSARMESEPQIKTESLPKLSPLKEPESEQLQSKQGSNPKAEPPKLPVPEPDDGFPKVKPKSPSDKDGNKEKSAPVDREVLAVTKKFNESNILTKLSTLQILGKRGTDGGKYAGLICDAILDSNPQVRTAAVEALEKVRPDLYKPVTMLMVDATPANQDAGILQLTRMGEEAAPAINLVLYSLTGALSGGLNNNSKNDRGDGQLLPRQLILIDAVNNIKPTDPTIINIYKSTAVNWSRKGWNCVMIVSLIEEWAGDNVNRRKEFLPILMTVILNEQSGLPANRHQPQIKCMEILGEYGPLAVKFAPLLKKLKLSSDASIRDAAALALEKVESK